MTARLREPSSGGGVGGPDVDAFEFTQDAPSALWLVAHPLGIKPNVSVVDTIEREVEADVQYIDAYNLTIAFANPATGKAYLS